jgi:hypothetical protein
LVARMKIGTLHELRKILFSWNFLHSMDLKAVKKGRVRLHSYAESAVSLLQTKTREKSLGFQCQVIGLSHGSLTCMQDVDTTKHPEFLSSPEISAQDTKRSENYIFYTVSNGPNSTRPRTWVVSLFRGLTETRPWSIWAASYEAADDLRRMDALLALCYQRSAGTVASCCENSFLQASVGEGVTSTAQ